MLVSDAVNGYDVYWVGILLCPRIISSSPLTPILASDDQWLSELSSEGGRNTLYWYCFSFIISVCDLVLGYKARELSYF